MAALGMPQNVTDINFLLVGTVKSGANYIAHYSPSLGSNTGGALEVVVDAGGFVNTATDTHTHSCSTTTSSASNLLPYMNVIYGQRKDPSPSASVGSEEAVSSGGGDGITYQYLYNGHGEMFAETNGPSSTSTAGGGLVNTSSSDHTHSCATTTSEHTNEPPYLEVIYGQRKDNQIHLEALEKGIIKLWKMSLVRK